MKLYNFEEAEKDFIEIVESLENKKEDTVLICRNDKPILKVELFKNDRSKLIGSLKGEFEVPEDFDDIDISEDFKEEIFPK